ncbi:MAG: DoxX family membrane protein, partial [Alphaproteobacteria bacterium]|nr:DoxX family membrane protein [Alphaproteobacteria bacterium]
MRWPFGYDVSELMFRVLFSSIFLGLGAEHLFSDQLIQQLMPTWMPAPRVVSICAGLVLLTGGVQVLLGLHLRRAAWLLGAFLVVVTAVVHVPGVLLPPPADFGEAEWMWTVLQRSNLVKNLCLLGVCVQLGWHRPG